jgi:hypothetical protein
MKKGMFLGILFLLLGSCSKDDPPPKVPGEVFLLFPENNSLCITGISQSPTTSEVTFRWEAATTTDTYELLVTELNGSTTQRQITSGLSASVVLDKGVPYSWRVKAINQDSGKETSSTVWQFYNAGSSLSYPPFPASLLEPTSGASVFPDVNSQVLLEWEPSDPDNDLLEIEVYFGTDPDALPMFASLCCAAVNLQVSVSSGTVYYWQILCRDEAGNTSLSSLNSFRAL